MSFCLYKVILARTLYIQFHFLLKVESIKILILSFALGMLKSIIFAVAVQLFAHTTTGKLLHHIILGF